MLWVPREQEYEGRRWAFLGHGVMGACDFLVLEQTMDMMMHEWEDSVSYNIARILSNTQSISSAWLGENNYWNRLESKLSEKMSYVHVKSVMCVFALIS